MQPQTSNENSSSIFINISKLKTSFILDFHIHSFSSKEIIYYLLLKDILYYECVIMCNNS